MSSSSVTVKVDQAKNNFDRIFFSPLDKIKTIYESKKSGKSDLVILRPLDKLKEKIENIPKNSYQHCTIPTYDELINAESALGRTIFGIIPAGHQREFFQQKKNVWVWYESWEENEVKRQITIRYEVREDGVYKKPIGKGYTKIDGEELNNFCQACRAYLKICKENLY